MTGYTGPEMNTERRICGRIRAAILRDPCRFCLNRVEGWDLAACKEPGRRYPLCGTDGRALKFDPDYDAIKRRKEA